MSISEGATEPRVAGNTATGFLKLAALLFMCCDHFGKMLLPGVPEMRMIGRLAFPLYAWCLVVGASYTRSMGKYTLRLLGVGLVSQPIYMQALNHQWTEPNIFLTLLVALLGLWGLKDRRWYAWLWAPVLSILLAVLLKCDYGWKGVLFILLLWQVRDSRRGIAAVFIAFCLYWGSTSTQIITLFGQRVSTAWMGSLSVLAAPWLRLQALAVLALPLVLWHCPWQIRLPKWLGYALYPMHLVLLWLVEQVH